MNIFGLRKGTPIYIALRFSLFILFKCSPPPRTRCPKGAECWLSKKGINKLVFLCNRSLDDDFFKSWIFSVLSLKVNSLRTTILTCWICLEEQSIHWSKYLLHEFSWLICRVSKIVPLYLRKFWQTLGMYPIFIVLNWCYNLKPFFDQHIFQNNDRWSIRYNHLC